MHEFAFIDLDKCISCCFFDRSKQQDFNEIITRSENSRLLVGIKFVTETGAHDSLMIMHVLNLKNKF